MDRADTDRLLAELEKKIKGRRRWRGRRVFYQVLDYELGPILESADDPTYVRGRVQEILSRHGHALEAPPMPFPVGDTGGLFRAINPPPR